MASLVQKPILVESSVGLELNGTYSHLQPLAHEVFLGSHKLATFSTGRKSLSSQDISFKPLPSDSFKIHLNPCLIHTTKRSNIVRSLYSSGDGSVGDSKLQQVLVDMVRIQVGKVRMVEFVDERSQHLRSIADEATFEFDQIAYRTMKGLDATGSRVRDAFSRFLLELSVLFASFLFQYSVLWCA
jgi:hypothetical protein